MKSRVNNFYSQLKADDSADTVSKLVWNDKNFFPTIYYYNRKNDSRRYCIRINDLKKSQLLKFPKWDGLLINLIEIDSYPEEKGQYLVFEQHQNQEADIFELMMSDLEEKTRDVVSNSSLTNIIKNVLQKWKHFFQTSPDGKLSLEKQQGLYAELLFLKSIINKIGVQAVYCWSGPDGESRDFYLNGNGFEIKSSSKKENKVTISNENQLDNTDINGKLYLIFYSLRRSNVDGESLPQIVESIIGLINKDDVAVDEFEEKLFSAGYLKNHNELYEHLFSERERKIYYVHEKFPRITKNMLMDGISSITYELNLDTCSNFLVKNSDISMLISPEVK